MKQGRIDSAELTLRGGMRKVGETALLTNLAKVFAERGDGGARTSLLQQTLKADPNMENAFDVVGGDSARKRVGICIFNCASCGSSVVGARSFWLWHHLEQAGRSGARSSTVLAQGLYDASALMMISGDLGEMGR